MNFLDLLAPHPFIPPQNVVYFIMITFFGSQNLHILYKSCAKI